MLIRINFVIFGFEIELKLGFFDRDLVVGGWLSDCSGFGCLPWYFKILDLT